MQAIQQQMQQWSIANGAATNNPGQSASLNQFSFPAATPVMMPTPTMFNQSMANQNQSQQSVASNVPQLSQSHHSNGNGSPQSNHSGGSNDKLGTSTSAKTWSKKQQKLGDQLYEKVFKKTGKVNAPKITGMLLKMGNTKAQQCIDNPHFLVEQIQIAKKLLDTTEGLSISNGHLSPTSMLLSNGHSNSPKQTTPLMQRLNSPNHALLNGHTSPTKQFQALNTNKPLSPNNIAPINSPNTPNQKLLSSVPNLLTSSIPNSLYGTMPIFGTPQLFAMSPSTAANNASSANMNGHGSTSPNRVNKPLLNSSIPNSNGFVYTMPNLVTSPNSRQQQHSLYNLNGVNTVTTPNGIDSHQTQQSNIQQSGWGLAVSPQVNMIQTQPATNFMQPSFYSRTSQ